MTEMIESRLRKWGNSYGLVVPISFMKDNNIKEGQEVQAVIIKKEKLNVLRETFGKHKFSKSVKQLMKETDKALYDI